jgi:hypothetical protein
MGYVDEDCWKPVLSGQSYEGSWCQKAIQPSRPKSTKILSTQHLVSFSSFDAA